MSGRKQHYIPQSFQRGFLISEQSRQTHVYRSNKNYVSNIDSVAAQRDFYSKPSGDGSKTLDDKITDYENRLANLLHTLRGVEIGSQVDARTAAEVIAHLTPRISSVRSMFGSSATKLINGASEILSDKQTFISLLGLGEPAPNDTWNERVVSVLKENVSVNLAIEFFLEQKKIPKVCLDRWIFMLGKEYMLGATNPIPHELHQMFSGLLTGIDDVVSDSHRKILENGLVAEPRMQSLEKLTWYIRPAPIEGAIMPDCIALGFAEEEGTFLPYIMTSTASAVVMPLTSKKLLVGLSEASAVSDLSNFNHEASECSDELFIASSSTHADLSEHIGKRWKSKMDSVVQDALGNLQSHRHTQSGVLKVKPASLESYHVTFIGWSTEDDIALINRTIQSVVEKLRQWIDLTRMDGITFTSEFRKTLAETERGFDNSTSPERIPDHIAHEAAALLVMRNGRLMVRLFFNNTYAHSLVGEDVHDAEVALHLLVAGLSLARTVSLFEDRIPGFLMEPVRADNHNAILHCAMRKALRAYRYAYDSAKFGAEDLFEQEFSDYVIQALDFAYPHIAKAKEEHAADTDYPKLFNSVFGVVIDILIASARLIGHRHGMGKAGLPIPETSVGAAIVARQLTGWVNAFAYDLQQFWMGEFWTREHVYALNIHVERLLWPFGIFLYPDDSGQETMILSIQTN
jgi:hypothetical protein